MKFIVVLLVILVVIWIVRSSTADRPPQDRQDAQPRRPQPPALPQDMVQCPVCSVHLPRSEALPGPDGQMYCCPEHRARAAG